MDDKTKRIFSIVMTIGILGVTVYAIKKYYDSKKQDEQSISLDEAKAIVEAEIKDNHDYNIEYKPDDRIISKDDMENIKFGARDQAHYDPNFKRTNLDIDSVRTEGVAYTYSNRSSNKLTPIGKKPEELAVTQEEDEEEDEEWFEGVDPEEIQDSKGYFEEDKDVIDDLRYEPNSIEAREQFINMELANLGRNNDTRDIVAMLYDHPFFPTCDEDQNLKTRLIDHRIKFFGYTSKWINYVTIGDLIMYYGKSAEYNCQNDVRHWVDYFLTCGDLNDITLTSDEIDERIDRLNSHTFFHEDLQSHGLFGLTDQQMNEALSVASKRIDEKLTYDIEFHQFVQGVI